MLQLSVSNFFYQFSIHPAHILSSLFPHLCLAIDLQHCRKDEVKELFQCINSALVFPPIRGPPGKLPDTLGTRERVIDSLYCLAGFSSLVLLGKVLILFHPAFFRIAASAHSILWLTLQQPSGLRRRVKNGIYYTLAIIPQVKPNSKATHHWL